jgi:hypothetical protein
MDEYGNAEIPPNNRIIEEVMHLLSFSEKASYTIYLNLCKQFGSGQGFGEKVKPYLTEECGNISIDSTCTRVEENAETQAV